MAKSLTAKFRLFPGKFRLFPGKFRLWFLKFLWKGDKFRPDDLLCQLVADGSCPSPWLPRALSVDDACLSYAGLLLHLPQKMLQLHVSTYKINCMFSNCFVIVTTKCLEFQGFCVTCPPKNWCCSYSCLKLARCARSVAQWFHHPDKKTCAAASSHRVHVIVVCRERFQNAFISRSCAKMQTYCLV